MYIRCTCLDTCECGCECIRCGACIVCISVVRWGEVNYEVLKIIDARLPRNSDRSPSGTKGTPGNTSDPLALDIIPYLPHKATGANRAPEGRLHLHRTSWQWTLSHASGYIPDPWQCTLSPTYHTSEAETKGHRGDARARIRFLGEVQCPTPAT